MDVNLRTGVQFFPLMVRAFENLHENPNEGWEMSEPVDLEFFCNNFENSPIGEIPLAAM